MYAKIENGSLVKFPYNENDLKIENPNTSFPAQISDSLLADWNVFPVTVQSSAEYNPLTHKEVRDSEPTLVDGVWTLGKSYELLTDNEKQAYIKQQSRVYELKVQKHMDEKVAEREYDSMISACTYATSSNPKYGPEGQACLQWRDAVWDKCYQVLAEVQAGTRQPPEIQELIDELPELVWPQTMPEVTENRLVRLEKKIDDLQHAVISLARVEERLTTVFNRQSGIEQKVNNMDTSIDKLQRGAAAGAYMERLFWIAVVAAVTWISRQV